MKRGKPTSGVAKRRAAFSGVVTGTEERVVVGGGGGSSGGGGGGAGDGDHYVPAEESDGEDYDIYNPVLTDVEYRFCLLR